MTKVVSLVFILILFTWLLHKPKPIQNNIQNNNKQTKSNLQNLIDQANHIFIIENFESSPPQEDPVENLGQQMDKSPSPEPTQASTTTQEPSEPEDTSSNITEIINNLEDLEAKCEIFEKTQTQKFKDEQEVLEEDNRRQLDLENEKIDQLKDIVAYYKKQYDTKINLNTQCRTEKGLKLNEDLKTINNNVDKLRSKNVVLELK